LRPEPAVLKVNIVDGAGGVSVGRIARLKIGDDRSEVEFPDVEGVVLLLVDGTRSNTRREI